MSVTPFEHPFLAGLLGDAEIAAAFAAERDIAAMLAFEAALAETEAAEGLIPWSAAEHIRAVCASFEPDRAALATATARDGVVVPELVRQLRRAVGEPHQTHVHFGATSQDLIDTALVLRLAGVCESLDRRLGALVERLDALIAAFGDRPVIGRTRMQRAEMIRFAQRFDNWRAPLSAARADLASLAPSLLVVQFGGAVGNRAGLGERGDQVAAGLAHRLGLAVGPVWHTRRASLVKFAGVLSLITGALGKIGIDCGLMAQNEIAEVKLAGAGGSSAMPHKANPVLAEVLVSLARFNAVQLGGMHQALVHEFERSGAAWTLEWLILPSMTVAAGAALARAATLLDGLSVTASA